MLLATAFELSVPAIDAILLAAIQQSFLPVERKQALVDTWRAELDTLKAMYLARS